MTDAIRERVIALQREFAEKGDPTGWFEALYREVDGDNERIPWADLEPNKYLVEWLLREKPDPAGKKAIVVGCGLGDDAEKLAKYGFDVTAFDISPTAIEWAKRITPDSKVDYVVADLFEMPAEWHGAFDFVLEIYTIQPLPLELRPKVIEKIAGLVKTDGEILVICRGRDDDELAEEMPFPLSRKDLREFGKHGLTEVSFEDIEDHEIDPPRRFRALYRR
jgi:SAM-dependent methyltransferase